MSGLVDAHVTGLHELAQALDQAAVDVTEEVRKITARGAFNVKKDWQQRWQGLAHAPALPRAISYDVSVQGSTITAEVGPDKDKRQGALGNLVEYGSIHNAPRPGGAPALEAETPRYQQQLEDLAVRLLER